MTAAMDSARKYDLNGWFEVADNPISKEGIFPYSSDQVQGPEMGRLYRVYRPAEELSDPETLASFRLLPIIDDHTMLGEGGTPAEDKGVAGVIGENVRFEGGKLLANLKIYSDALAKKIKAGKTELSCGYRCTYDFTPGVWNGQEYDAVQRQIRGNHLALVDEGRMGRDVAILDHMTFTADAKEISPVDEELKQMLASIVARLDKLEAGEVGEKPAGDEDPTAKPEADPAAAGDEDPAAKPEADPAVAGDEDPAAAEKTGMDALTKQVKALTAKVAALTAKPAMDEALLVNTIARKTDLANRLTPHIGVFDHSKMTLADVAKYGVEKLELKNVPKGSELVALDAALQVRKPATPLTSMDHAAPSPLAKSVTDYVNKN